jgi:hypothetical protein
MPSILLIADKYGTITGLSHPVKKSHQTAAQTFFELSLPQCVTRFKSGPIRPPWRRQRTTGIITDDIIGSCTDGTIYSFTIVDHEARVLLKFLENLVRWEERVGLGRKGRGFFGSSPKDDVNTDDEERSTDRFIIDPEWEATGPSQRKTSYAINADVLERFLECDGISSLLRTLELDDGFESGERAGATGRWNGNARSERIKRFKECLFNLLGDEGLDPEEDLESACRRCVDWLRGVLVGML